MDYILVKPKVHGRKIPGTLLLGYKINGGVMKKILLSALILLPLVLLQGCRLHGMWDKSKSHKKGDKVVSASFSPDSKRILVVFKNSAILYDATNGSQIKALYSPFSIEAFEQWEKDKGIPKNRK